MTTSSGHTTAILASKVKGTAVYNGSGEKIGTVEDIVLDKQSNQVGCEIADNHENYVVHDEHHELTPLNTCLGRELTCC